ncbi:MAG: CRTAC1 family protein [Caldilineaceae bacterium]
MCRNHQGWLVSLIIILLLVACQPVQPVVNRGEAPQGATNPVIDLQIEPLATPSPCTDSFVAHKLDHITTIEGQVVRLFESNGAGLAINDLDNDGDLDLVLANLAGPNAIFWNEGDLIFRKETLAHGDSRAVAIVDVDGDGRQDIVFTRRTIAPTLWRNQPGAQPNIPTFVETFLSGVNKQAYAMTWGDPDGDGDLDLVTGSYDLTLQMALGDKFRFGEGAGLHYYEQREGVFVRHFLDRHAQTLALIFFDVNQDGRPDIVAGNDFDVPDEIWLNTDTGWQAAPPFTATTQNTMSFDAGDINNDGRFELFATDMMPYAHDAATMAAWQPVMDRMPHEMHEGDPQMMENVLQIADPTGFINGALAAGIAETGWSWSSKFGDLDNDGLLDLYVVNGMAALDLFAHLPNNELVEENQVFHNQGDGLFQPAPTWGLNSTAGGRGMSMADLDQDGDLDIVVNNLLSPAMIFENQLCGGAGVEVDLFWPTSRNTRAVGAQLVLHTDQGDFYREVRATSGYLSGDPARVHFGLPADATPQQVEILWPDGKRSQVELSSMGVLLQVTRG